MRARLAGLAAILAAVFPLLGSAESGSTRSLNAIADDYAAAAGARSLRPRLSPRANAAWLSALRRLEIRLAHVKAARLDEPARLTRRMLARELAFERGHVAGGHLAEELGGSDSPLQAVVNGAQTTELRTVNDWRWTLATLRGAPRLLADYQLLLERGLAEGRARPAEAVRSALAFLDTVTRRDRENPFLALRGALEKNLAGNPRLPELRRELARVLGEDVLPAHRRIRRFLAERYLPRAARLGASREAYLHELERHLGPGHPSPEALGRWGRLEVRRLQRELERAVAAVAPGAGSAAAYLARLSRSRATSFATGDALLAAAEHELAKARRVARAMTAVPPSEVAVTPVPRQEEATVLAQYLSPAEGRGELQLNTGKLRPALRRHALATLVTHEVYGGHHLAAMRAQRQARLPAYRRDAALTGYDEGWALYAEAWRDAHGGFTPEERIGFLVMHLQRAARLVVDTGLHTGAMTRADAVEYFRQAAYLSRGAAEAEIERYINRPAQALAYYYGKRQILRTKARCQKILGPRFDERVFHTRLLDLGSVPLDELERAMLSWARRRAGQP
jgi:uncharacterized protein (DUF885 family)